MPSLVIALAQINVTVGALQANAERIAQAASRARAGGAQVVVFPELALSGYPPEDLLLKRHFLEDCEQHLAWLAKEVPSELVCLVGSPRRQPGKAHNGAVVLCGGQVAASYSKMLLPNYGVFDEQRVLAPGARAMGLELNGLRLGIHICEDSWYTDAPPCRAYRAAAPAAILNLSSSPYHRTKRAERAAVLGRMASALNTTVLYCNLIGGQDELVFDGASMVLDRHGEVRAQAEAFVEDLLLYELEGDAHTSSPAATDEVDWLRLQPAAAGPRPPARTLPDRVDLAEVYGALKLGLHDYVRKNGFEQTVIAVSGGIDSALVTTLAVDALGPGRVTGVTMPSLYSSAGTRNDAEQLARNLGIPLLTLPIGSLFDAFMTDLQPLWKDRPADTTEENLQARIRGTLVMALSNKFGWLVLTTGNKSEMATGYCTLYGDMVGGFAVIKDVPKTLVFELCAWRNAQDGGPCIPPTTLSRPPSAELRPDQKDSDSLPPYDVLDPILAGYVEQDQSAAALVAAGYDAALVERVIRLVDSNEYKRRQGAPGIKITPKAFGRDRRLPITNRYREQA